MPADYFASDLNQGTDIAQMGVADERQCYWKRWCKFHYAYQTGKSILDNGRNSLDCRICRIFIHEDHRDASEHEIQAYMVMKDLQLEPHYWIIESRVLGSNLSSVDIWIRSCELLVMIDGEGHFDEMFGIPYTQRRDVDRRFNAEAKKQGFHVLRLHHKDDPRKLECVIKQCSSSIGKRQPLLIHSKSYFICR